MKAGNNKEVAGIIILVAGGSSLIILFYCVPMLFHKGRLFRSDISRADLENLLRNITSTVKVSVYLKIIFVKKITSTDDVGRRQYKYRRNQCW
jgi:hypothetical protein